MPRLNAAAVAAAVLALAGCGQGAQAPSISANSQYQLGDSIEFKRKDNGQKIGTIRILEVVAVPEECLFDPGLAIAVRAEIESPGELFLPRPDTFGLKVIDRAGFTQDVSLLNVRSECGFPDIASSQPYGKTAGWETVGVQEADPTALVYAPLVGEPDSTLENLKFVAVSPTSVTISLPTPLPRRNVPASGPAPAPTTTQAPATAERPRPASGPAAGKPCNINSDTWAKDASGQQLRCAYAGNPTPTWVESLPFVGTRRPGQACELGVAVAETADGQTLVCVGEADSATWQPGP